MMNPDMSGVDPMRWAEVRRRVAAVQAFLALDRPTAVEREAAAASIGLSSKSFMRLVQAWRLHADASRLEGAATRGISRPRASATTDEIREIIRMAKRNAPKRETLAALTDRVAAICAGASIKPPSRSAVWYVLRHLTNEPDTAAREPAVLLGNAWAMVPVQTTDGISRPLLTLAIAVPERFIVGREITFGSSGPAYGSLLSRIASSSFVDAAPRRLVLPPTGPQPTGSGAAALLGDRIANLRLIYRQKSAVPAAKMLLSRLDAPMSIEDATTYIDMQIDRHNASLTMPVDFAFRLT